jgi:hypothetical protein
MVKEGDQEEDSIDLEEYKSANEADLHKDMVSTPARHTKKTPSKGTPSGESPTTEIAKAVSQLRVSNSSTIPAFVPYQLTAVFPFAISDYDEGEDVMCNIPFCVPSYPLEFFLPDVINKWTHLLTYFKPPCFLC